MNKTTKILAFLLSVLLAATLLCACESTEEKYAALAGTWIMYEQDSEEQVMVLLESIDLYEEEIALVDKTSLRYAWIFEFDTAGNIRQAQPVEENKALVREFYEGMFDAFFDGRASLDDLYEDDLSSMNQDEFKLFYAELYGFDTFEALLDQFVQNAYVYDEWTDLRNGTFTFDSNRLSIIDSVEGENGLPSSYSIIYKLEGDTLTLTYSDGVEVYTRVR
ncbi:MAG: hypothetical protein IJO45_02165 [Oscillospiraceae bacterium]|nr:hypothetical protein [Oscillospiraceae bacterium]